MQAKFSIGEKVLGQKTGTLTPSHIVGVIRGIDALYIIYNGIAPKGWDQFGEWYNKPVYVCKFDEPTRNVSFIEHSKYFEECVINELDTSLKNLFIKLKEENPKLYKQYLETHYEIKTPKTIYVFYVEDDLVSYEEALNV